jgi:hypothetical protein
VEFPPGFPVTERQALAWVSGAELALPAEVGPVDPEFVMEIWHGMPGIGFKDGAGRPVEHWARYVGGRWRKERGEWLGKRNGSISAKKRGGRFDKPVRPGVAVRVRTHARLPEPPCDWRGVLREMFPVADYPQLDHAGVAWGMMEPEVRRDVECECRKRGVLAGDWVQPGVPAEG